MSPPRGAAASARRRLRWAVGVGAGVVALAGCGDLVGSAPLPPGTQGPTTYNTPEGALGFYRGVKEFVRTGAGDNAAAPNLVVVGGALTDELAWAGRGTSPLSLGATGEPVDERLLPESPTAGELNVASTYSYLQGLRARALQGIGLLRTYAPEASPALAGELQALEGYAEVLLGELFCSGVPLSTLDFQGDFTYKPGSTTDEVWRHAAALSDSAAAVSADSARVVWFARVVKGRALLNLGDYAGAAQAVASVPDDFQYAVPTRVDAWRGGESDPAFLNYTVADGEGGTGLPYASSGDPRSAVTAVGANLFGLPLYTPDKYPAGTTAPVVLASGVEARLIEAEAALHGVASPRGSWLEILNALRTDGTVAGTSTRACQPGVDDGAGGVLQAGSPCPAGVVDTTWGPGAGAYLIPAAVLADAGPDCPTAPAPGVACADTVWYRGLAPLADPGTADPRVNLLFRERAYWLFLTAHRAGDLRRLVRNYQRAPNTVYPSGAYYGGQGAYGTDVTLPVPPAERANPQFRGCRSREA